MLGRLEMDVDECIAAYSELMKTVFGKRSSKLPFSWTGKTKARFDSKKLKSAVEKAVTNNNASSTEFFDNGTARGCRVLVAPIYRSQYGSHHANADGQVRVQYCA
jgi:hypothetical protein